MFIAPGQGLTTPWGRNFDANKNILSLRLFVASSKKYLFEVWFYKKKKKKKKNHDLTHVYNPRARADSPQETQFSYQQKWLVTSFICCKFKKKMSLKSDFKQFCHELIVMYIAQGQGQGTKFWCQQKGLITLPICCKFQRNLSLHIIWEALNCLLSVMFECQVSLLSVACIFKPA